MMGMWLWIFPVVLLVIVSSSPDLVQGKGLTCSCQLDNVYSKKIDIHCGKSSNAASSTVGGNSVSCEKEVLGSVARGYSYVEGFGLYKLHRTAKDYASAANFCEYEGASLFIPDSEEEVERVMPLFKDNPKLSQVFIGITDMADEGKFVTSQGVALTSLTFQTWKSGQPDNYRDEDCLTLTDQGELNDESCSSWQAFLCERNVTAVPRGYSYEEGFGFYRLCSGQQRATFREAVRRCERDGAALSVPDTYDEAAILLRLYDQVPGVHDGWVGVSDLREEGNYVTTTGKSLSSLQFQNWGSGEPNRENPEAEDCVGLHEAGILADYNCDDQKPYVCEIPFDY